VVTAAQEPNIDVCGIDPSAASIKEAEDYRVAEKVDNLELVNTDLANLTSWTRFDAVICSGVLHHVPDASTFLRKLRALCMPNARVVIMVYGDICRAFVPEVCRVFKLLDLQPDAKGVAFVRRLMMMLPEGHPAREFFDATDRADTQVADLWLHPYFRQYAVTQLVSQMLAHDFTLEKWLSPNCDASGLFDKIPKPFAEVRTAWERLSPLDQARVGQILNHTDAKVTGAFRASDRETVDAETRRLFGHDRS
jgi:ubiquinone/menaquinone biosynthesis C-methylase UbiE